MISSQIWVPGTNGVQFHIKNHPFNSITHPLPELLLFIGHAGHNSRKPVSQDAQLSAIKNSQREPGANIENDRAGGWCG